MMANFTAERLPLCAMIRLSVARIPAHALARFRPGLPLLPPLLLWRPESARRGKVPTGFSLTARIHPANGNGPNLLEFPLHLESLFFHTIQDNPDIAAHRTGRFPSACAPIVGHGSW